MDPFAAEFVRESLCGRAVRAIVQDDVAAFAPDRAVAAPIPRDAPVMKTALPAMIPLLMRPPVRQ